MASERFMILTDRLTKAFGSLIAVNQLSFEVPEGQIYGLLGPDGSGKTTTMRLLTAILTPTSGKGWVNGKEIVEEGEVLKESIGYMSQRFGLYQDLTVQENLNFYADLYGLSSLERKTKIESLLKFSQLAAFKNRLAGQLSGGMKQKLGLSCALIHTPKVLFLDEPTNGVDPISRREFWQILYGLLKEKVTILISTTYMDEAERCHQIAFLNQGKLLAKGTPSQMKELFKGKLFLLRPHQPRLATQKLIETFGEESVTLFGNRLHLSAPDLHRARQMVDQALSQWPEQERQLQEIAPSLEDSFVSLLMQPNQRGQDDPL